MKESIYDLYLFYKIGSFGIVRMQINNKLILANNNFASKEEETIKLTKIMRKIESILSLHNP